MCVNVVLVRRVFLWGLFHLQHWRIFYMKEFDGLLYGKLKKMELNNPIYTRYADDIVISFKTGKDDFEKIDNIKAEVQSLLKKVHLTLNEKKRKAIP